MIDIGKHKKTIWRLLLFLISIVILVILTLFFQPEVLTFSDSKEEISAERPKEKVSLYLKTGEIDPESGLVIDDGIDLVRAHCTSCHSTSVLSQTNLSRKEWLNLIRWMQEDQKLWDLGKDEELILNYLEKNYGPLKGDSRAPLENIEWYELEE